MDSHTIRGILGMSTVVFALIAALVTSRQTKQSALAVQDLKSQDAMRDDELFFATAGYVNGQNYLPLYVAVSDSGVAFKAMGFRIKLPYEDIETTERRSLFFKYVYIRSKRDPSLKIRIGSSLAKEISGQSGGRFMFSASQPTSAKSSR
jgi:hypothetical protein